MTQTIDLPDISGSLNQDSDLLRVLRPDVEGAVDGKEYKSTLSGLNLGAAGNFLPLSGSEMSGSIAMQDNVLERPEIKDYSETLSSATSSGSTYTIDLEQGNIHKVVLNTDCTFSFSNPPPTDRVGSFTLIAIQSSEGSKSATWPGTVDWASGTAPTLTDAANASDIFTFMSYDGGAQWFGFLAGGKMG